MGFFGEENTLNCGTGRKTRNILDHRRRSVNSAGRCSFTYYGVPASPF